MLRLFLALYLAVVHSNAKQIDLCYREVVITRLEKDFNLKSIFLSMVPIVSKKPQASLLQVKESIFSSEGKHLNSKTYNLEFESGNNKDNNKNFGIQLHSTGHVNIEISSFNQVKTDANGNSSLNLGNSFERKYDLYETKQSVQYLGHSYKCIDGDYRLILSSSEMGKDKNERDMFIVKLQDTRQQLPSRKVTTVRDYSLTEIRKIKQTHRFEQFAVPK